MSYAVFLWSITSGQPHSSVVVVVHTIVFGSVHVFAIARSLATFARSVAHVGGPLSMGAVSAVDVSIIASLALASPIVASLAIASCPPSVTGVVVQSYEHAADTTTSVAIASEGRARGMDSKELTRRMTAFNRAWIVPVW